jgi:hypothetical protein
VERTLSEGTQSPSTLISTINDTERDTAVEIYIGSIQKYEIIKAMKKLKNGKSG